MISRHNRLRRLQKFVNAEFQCRLFVLFNQANVHLDCKLRLDKIVSWVINQQKNLKSIIFGT